MEEQLSTLKEKHRREIVAAAQHTETKLDLLKDELNEDWKAKLDKAVGGAEKKVLARYKMLEEDYTALNDQHGDIKTRARASESAPGSPRI